MHNQRLLIGAKPLIALSLLIYLLQDVNLGDIFETIRSADIPFLAFAFSLYAIGYLITGFRLHLLISVYGKKAPVRFLIQSFMIATFFNNFLPSTVGGDLSRSYDLWQYFGDKSRAVASILIDRFLGLFALLLFIVFSTLLAKEFVFSESTVYLWISGATFSAVLIIYLIFFTPQWLLDLASRYGTRLHKRNRAKRRRLCIFLFLLWRIKQCGNRLCLGHVRICPDAGTIRRDRIVLRRKREEKLESVPNDT
jgi:uncharacterized protein (TIRG00374 family)